MPVAARYQMVVVGLAVALVALIGVALTRPSATTDTGRESAAGIAAASPGFSPLATRPQAVSGLRVMSVSEALTALAAGELHSQRVAIGGYFSAYTGPGECGFVDPARDATLELACSDGHYGITDEAEPIFLASPSGRVTMAVSAHLTPWIPPDVRAEMPDLPRIDDHTLPVPIVVVGHFGDPRAAECRPAARTLCSNRLVLDEIAWIEVGAAVWPGPTPS